MWEIGIDENGNLYNKEVDPEDDLQKVIDNVEEALRDTGRLAQNDGAKPSYRKGGTENSWLANAISKCQNKLNALDDPSSDLAKRREKFFLAIYMALSMNYYIVGEPEWNELKKGDIVQTTQRYANFFDTRGPIENGKIIEIFTKANKMNTIALVEVEGKFQFISVYWLEKVIIQ